MRVHTGYVLKQALDLFLLFFTESGLLLLIFRDQLIYGFTIHPYEADFIPFVFECLYEVIVQNLVEQQNVVSVILSSSDVAVLSILVEGINSHPNAVFIGLIVFDLLQIFIYRRKFILRVFEKCGIFHPIVKLLIADHTVLDKYTDILPFILKLLTILVE